MNPYRNAFRLFIRRQMDDFQYGEELFETEDGPIPFESEERDDHAEGNETELKEAA